MTASVRTCTIAGCGRPHRCVGLCEAHYTRLLKSGTTDPSRPVGRRLSGTDEDRFDAQVSLDNATGCWLWTGRLGAGGYGTFPINRRNTAAHRFSYERYVGPITNGLYVCHHCDVRNCVNPAHLFLGTHADNMEDCRKKGRNPSGYQHPFAIPSDKIAAVMALSGSGLSRRLIAERVGVSSSSVSRILNGQGHRDTPTRRHWTGCEEAA